MQQIGRGRAMLIVNCRPVWTSSSRARGYDPLPIQGSQPGAPVGTGR